MLLRALFALKATSMWRARRVVSFSFLKKRCLFFLGGVNFSPKADPPQRSLGLSPGRNMLSLSPLEFEQNGHGVSNPSTLSNVSRVFKEKEESKFCPIALIQNRVFNVLPAFNFSSTETSKTTKF